jgi:hypothetical protein
MGCFVATARCEDTGQIVGAILGLDKTTRSGKTTGDTGATVLTDWKGRLFGGDIDATIVDGNDDDDDFGRGDVLDLVVTPARGGKPLRFDPGSPTEFRQWVKDHAEDLLAILFPTSISEGLSGESAAQGHSQRLVARLLDQGPRRLKAAGLIDGELFEVDGADGTAIQSVVYVDALAAAVTARYARIDDDGETRSVGVGVDVLPRLSLTDAPTRLDASPAEAWVGLNVFAHVVAANNWLFDNRLGAVDVGAGLWGAGRKDFDRVSLGVGAAALASTTHIPSFLISDDAVFLTNALNEVGLDFTLTYGAIVGYAVAERLSLDVKALETHSRSGVDDSSVLSETLVLVGITYDFGRVEPLPIGVAYSRSMGLEGVSAQSLAIQGNFRW